MLVINTGFFYWLGCSLLSLLIFNFNNLKKFIFIFFLFFSLFFWAVWLTGSWSSGLVSGLSLWGGRTKFRTTRDLPAPRNINQRELSHRSQSQCKDPAPLDGQQVPVLDTPSQTISKTGTEPHPLAERLPKIKLSSQTPQNTPPDTALPTRKTRSSPTHQKTGPSSLHQEAYSSHWTNLTHWGQTPTTTATMNLQPVKRRPQTQ